MYVSDLALDDFRSYDELVLALEPGPTAFIGPNGQGKTNLVEAIAYLSTLSSHRSGADTALVRRAASGEPQPGGAVVRAKVVHGERPSVLEIEIIAGRANRARLNRTASRPRALLGILRAVVFAPEDLALVREEPGVRRRFMDDLAVTLRPSLAGVRAEHDKILAQRASLLKSARAARRSGGVPASMLSSLEVWDAQLAAAAARLVAARVDVVARLRPWVMSSYERVSQGQSSARLVYRSSLLVHEGRSEPDPADEGARTAAEAELADVAATAARLETVMSRLREREIDRGANLVGAHRDELSLVLGGMPVKGYASHGESWSVALALRLGAFDLLSEDGDTPVLILDDVFAELDSSRREGLAALASKAEQIIVTCAVAGDLPASLDHHPLHVRLDPRRGTVIDGADHE